MKWFGLAMVILSFPAVLWITLGDTWDSDPRASDVADVLQISAKTPDSPENRPAPTISDLDLRAAATLTMKKINEIDEKIAAVQVELRKNQTNREGVVNGLLKIQAKIDAIVKAESNF